MSVPEPSGAQVLGEEVEILADPRHGARVFLNEGGGITIEQIRYPEPDQWVVVHLDEAAALARAILDVARAGRRARKERP